jgi:hypothetical protein
MYFIGIPCSCVDVTETIAALPALDNRPFDVDCNRDAVQCSAGLMAWRLRNQSMPHMAESRSRKGRQAREATSPIRRE